MLEIINGYVLGIAVPVILMGVGVFFGFYLNWFHFIHPIRTLKAAFGKNVRSAFSSLCLALAGTLGVGNIVGVASAIAMGGYGAVFWMWVSAFLAMILKYAEIVLAMRHRRYVGAKETRGSAMYYIEDCFESRRITWLGKGLSIAFASFLLLNALTMGSSLQTEAVAVALHGTVGIPTFAVSVALALLTALIIKKGRVGIMSFTEKIVPFMTLGFAVISTVAIVLRADRVPWAFESIFKSAFSPTAATGGIIGFLLSRALRFGVMRGLVSNEAGCGTSPMAHAASDGSEAASQGVWGIFEVFVDTIVLCTATALVIILSGVSVDTDSYMSITAGAYAAILGRPAEFFMAASVTFFGFATVVCWANYGMECVTYFSKRRRVKYLFAGAYCVAVALGGIISSEFMWQIADLSIGAITLINILCLFLCRREIREESRTLMDSGKKDK